MKTTISGLNEADWAVMGDEGIVARRISYYEAEEILRNTLQVKKHSGISIVTDDVAKRWIKSQGMTAV